MDEKYCLYPCAHFVSNTLNWVFKELLLAVPSAIQQVTDAIKQRAFTREIIRRIVSQSGS